MRLKETPNYTEETKNAVIVLMFRLVDDYQLFRENDHIHLQCKDKLIREIGNNLQNYTVPYKKDKLRFHRREKQHVTLST